MADHFSVVAARYAAFRPRYPAELVDALADRSPERGVAWDAGCGTGQLSVALAARFSRVIATDLAQKLIDAADPHPRVEYRCAPAEHSGLPDRCADLVVAAQAAHWFDFPRFCNEAARVGKPGALVALVSYGNLEIADAEVARIVTHYHHDVVGQYWPPGREHVENGYRDLVLPWRAVEAPAIEMTATWSREELIGYVSSWSATARLVDRQGPAEYDAVCAKLRAAWPAEERRTMRWPLTIKLARLEL
jgi:SAM-dependent methyltransferase